MMNEIFGTTLPSVVNGAFAATYVTMISVFNMLGKNYLGECIRLYRAQEYLPLFLRFRDITLLVDSLDSWSG